GAGFLPYYLGNGKFLNDSSTQGVSIGDLNSAYWSRYFNGNVRRVVE
ncbi:NlpC/P60 family protein, partial [Clostridium perfringens]